MKKVRTRFAPSPTGALHMGNVRAALFNYLFAKQQGGVFVLRIEDTDKERSSPEWEQDIVDNLKWLGLEWDEFYRQSERTEVYAKYLTQLLAQGKAYYCFCKEEDLEAQRQDQLSRGVAPSYKGTCRTLIAQEVEKGSMERVGPALHRDGHLRAAPEPIFGRIGVGLNLELFDGLDGGHKVRLVDARVLGVHAVERNHLVRLALAVG